MAGCGIVWERRAQLSRPLSVLAGGVSVSDPSEGKPPDFSQLTVQVQPTVTSLALSTHTAWGNGLVYCYLYGANAPQQFMLSFNGDDTSAVFRQDKGGDGHFETTIDGAVAITTNRLEKSMSLQHKGGYSGCNIERAWCYSMTSKDTIPDSGHLQVDTSSCPGHTAFLGLLNVVLSLSPHQPTAPCGQHCAGEDLNLVHCGWWR